MKKNIRLIFFLIIILFTPKLYAYDLHTDDKIGVSGDTIGIKLNTGVMVMGTFGINSEDDILMPWKSADIKNGDIIVSFNNKNIISSQDLLDELNDVENNTVSIKILRDDKYIESKITPTKYKDGYTLGMYIKDYIMGVGTLTYYIPQENIYGALGHSITNLDAYGGEVYEASVDEIIKPKKNKAGEKRAIISDDEFGEIDKNSTTGIHGTTYEDLDTSNMMMLSVGSRYDVYKGNAQILTSVDGDNIELFDIEITKVEKQDTLDIKGIKFSVTDERLIDISGGVVQGMSGSPIIQDNKIIGAVTHVLVNDATDGYGIFIEFMLEEMDVYLIP